MNPTLIEIVIAGLLFSAMLALTESGYRIGRRRKLRDPESSDAGLGEVDAAVFGLLGLTLAFTFSGAADRFAVRRTQIVEEANTIGTAYLRVDLLPAAEQPPIRALFKQYLESRIEVFEAFPDRAASNAALQRSKQLQGEIWARSVAACRKDANPSTATLLLTALNEMIDITTTRAVAASTHSPLIIFGLLVALSLLGALLSGYALARRGKRSLMHILVFALAVTGTICVVVDLDYPRAGLIHLRAADKPMLELRQSIR
jgi:ABC-type glycerol-3-phosphate transport system permease component